MKGGPKKTLSSPIKAVLVVGTTPDYVAKIYEKRPGSVVFLIDHHFEGDPHFNGIPPSALLFVPLDDIEETYRRTTLFLSANDISPEGTACFDCESLITSSRLASRLQNIFPPWQAIARSRNKFAAGRLWSSAGVASSAAILASDTVRTLDFLDSHREGIVLKPVSGSGSELLFHCRSEFEVREAVRVMERELPRRKTNPLFQPFPDPLGGIEGDPCRSWLAEEFIPGEEFSCDFVFQDQVITLIRETGKVKAPDLPFGSVLAYTFPPRYPRGFDKELLLDVLQKGLTALGFDWGYFMVDYMIRDGFPVLIEMTPRPGGDSIPDLLETAAGRDTLGIYLDFVSGRFSPPEQISMPPESFASINLYAPKEGTILRIDGSTINSLPEVQSLFLKKKRGDRLILPPKDYDNRLLGHCILRLKPRSDLLSECRRIEDLLDLSIQDEAIL